MSAHQDTMKHTFMSEGGLVAYLAPAGLALAVLAGITEAFAGLGSRWGWWYFTTGFTMLRWAAVCGLAAALLSLAGGIAVRHAAQRTALYMAASGILIGLAVAGIPWSWMRTAQQLPRIHDISTDTSDPPRFSALLEAEERRGQSVGIRRSQCCRAAAGSVSGHSADHAVGPAICGL